MELTRTVSVIAFTIGMVLALWFPVTPAGAAPGLVWGTAELIEIPDAGDTFGFSPQIAVDPQGNAVAVWSQAGVRAKRFVPGVGWGTAELLADSGVGRPQVAMDAAGNAVAAWPGPWTKRFVPGVGWRAPERISDTPGGSPQVAVDAQGNVVAVWQQGDGNRSNPRTSTWANRFVVGVGWGAAKLIETDKAGVSFGLQLAVNPQGDAFAVWIQRDGTRFTIWVIRGVEEPVNPTPPEVVTFAVVVGAIAVAAAVAALLLWRRRAGGKGKG